MKFITSNNKKLVALAAVVILCAACLVTVAYAYNAEYKDSVEQINITPSETSKYIYIDGNGLGYGSNPITVNVEIQYDTVYDNTSSDPDKKITYKPYGYHITGFPEGSVASLDNGVATVYLGDIVVRNSHTDASTVKLSVEESSFAQIDLSDGEYSLFQSDVTSNQIKFKVGDSYTDTVTFGTSPNVTVGVYVEAQIVSPVTKLQLPSTDRYYSSPDLFHGIDSTNLYLPGLKFTIIAKATDVATYTDGTVSASNITSVQNVGDELKIKTSDGASILLNTAAVNTLSPSDTLFTVSKNETVPNGADVAYDITLTQNGTLVTFVGTDNASLIVTVPYESSRTLSDGDTVTVAYVSNGDVSDLINGTYNATDKTVSFETTHLSTYAIMKTTSVAKIVTDTVATGYDTLASAVSAATNGQTVTLLSDYSGDGIAIMASASKTVTIDFGGHTFTATKGVGSTNYENQAFHLEKGNTVTLMNGKITTSGEGMMMVIQNYSNLTLTDLTVDGSHLVSGDYRMKYFNTGYQTFCSNNGTVSINGNTSIRAASGDNAYALVANWWGNSYPDGSQITIDTTGSIDSLILTADNANVSEAESKTTVSIKAGTIGSLTIEGDLPASNVSKSSEVSVTAPAKYAWSAANEGINTLVVAVASTVNGSQIEYFSTLDEAIASSSKDVAVALCADITSALYVSKDLTLDLAGHNLAVTANTNAIEVKGCSLNILDSIGGGKISSGGYGIYAFDGGNVTVTGITMETRAACLASNNTTGFGTFTVDNSILTADHTAIYLPNQQGLTVNGEKTVINGGISIRMGTVTINAGTVNGFTSGITDADSFNDYWSFSGEAWIGHAIYVWGGTYPATDTSCTININGGTINGNAHDAICIYDIGNKVSQNVNVVITSGATINGTVEVVDVSTIKDSLKAPTDAIGSQNVTVSLTAPSSLTVTFPSDYTTTENTERNTKTYTNSASTSS